MWFVLARIDIALPLWIAMLSRCLSHIDSLASPDFSEMRLPISETMTLVVGPKTPDVSIATGSNLLILDNTKYVFLLSSSAFLAASPAVPAVALTEHSAYVLTHVASQLSALPRLKGNMVTPSGLMLLSRFRPVGSRMAGVAEDFSARNIMSLRTQFPVIL